MRNPYLSSTLAFTLTLTLAIGLLLPSAMVSAQTKTPTPELTLSIAQTCAPMNKGGRCSLNFIQTMGDPLVENDVQERCAPGWVASITALRGSVEKGGINRGQAMVCGYTSPQEAIRGLMRTCDENTRGICSDANDVTVQWGFWSSTSDQIQALPRNQPLSISQFEQATRCQSPVPLVESVDCPPQAAVVLRQSGLR